MKHKLWEVFKRDTYTQGLKWCVQLPKSVAYFRTRKIAKTMAHGMDKSTWTDEDIVWNKEQSDDDGK